MGSNLTPPRFLFGGEVENKSSTPFEVGGGGGGRISGIFKDLRGEDPNFSPASAVGARVVLVSF